jgi:hypothetical protein
MKKEINSHRHTLVRDEDADFVAYQRNSDGTWQTISVWMIPKQVC